MASSTALTDANLKLFKTQMENMNAEINKWSGYLDAASKAINDTTGATFKADYAVGNKAVSNMQKIIDILNGLSGDLKKIVSDGKAFYKKQSTANTK